MRVLQFVGGLVGFFVLGAVLAAVGLDRGWPPPDLLDLVVALLVLVAFCFLVPLATLVVAPLAATLVHSVTVGSGPVLVDLVAATRVRIRLIPMSYATFVAAREPGRGPRAVKAAIAGVWLAVVAAIGLSVVAFPDRPFGLALGAGVVIWGATTDTVGRVRSLPTSRLVGDLVLTPAASRVINLRDAGRVDEADALLDSLLAEHPDDLYAAKLAADRSSRDGDDEQYRVLEGRLRAAHVDPLLLANERLTCLCARRELGEEPDDTWVREAPQLAETLRATPVRRPELADTLAQYLVLVGRIDEALKVLDDGDRSARTSVGATRAHLAATRALAEAARGDQEAARALLGRARRWEPGDERWDRIDAAIERRPHAPRC